jgi:methyl-accepting chemotaxis protein
MLQHTAGSSQLIGASMNQVTEMVSHIRHALQEERTDIEQVVSAVENISGMAKQVNRASLEQEKSSEQIARSMEDATERFSGISDQTETLRQEANQILAAMRTIELVSENISRNAAIISSETVENLVKHSDTLQNIVRVFKLS